MFLFYRCPRVIPDSPLERALRRLGSVIEGRLPLNGSGRQALALMT